MTMARAPGNQGRIAESRELRRLSVPRRGLSQVEAAVYVGFSSRKFDELIQRGLMPKPKRVDGVQVWDREQLDLYFSALPDEIAAPAPAKNYFDT